MKLREIKKLCIGHKKPITVITGEFTDYSENDLELLTKEELLRANEIDNQITRSRFIASKVFLRLSIGCILHIPLYRGVFLANEYGKPYLPKFYPILNFNLSHTTKNLIFVCITQNDEIGIDIENCNRKIPENLMEYVFRKEESNSILLSKNWEETFLQYWTSKEAVLKCIGCGFTLNPKRIRVSQNSNINMNFEAKELSISGSEKTTFRLLPIVHISNTIGAIAMMDRSK